jgi:acetyl esterase/lipase
MRHRIAAAIASALLLSSCGTAIDDGTVASTATTVGGPTVVVPDASEPAESSPEVNSEASYDVTMSTHVYATGQVHDDWGGPVMGTVDLVLDLYEPVDAPPGRPAMVMIHGGGFKGGSRSAESMTGFAQYFAERGWVTVSIDYRVADQHGTVPAELIARAEAEVEDAERRDQLLAMYPAARDAKAAVRWLTANADTFQIDVDHITALGGSAGSFLAVMLGVTEPGDYRDEVARADDPTLDSTNLDASASVHTIVDHWGGTAHLEVLELLDGRSRFDATDAPVSIVHGTEDPTVAFGEAEKLRDAYETTGVDYAFHPLEGKGHGVWGATVDGMTLHESAFAFVVEQQGLIVLP